MGVGSVLVSLFLPSLSPHTLRNLVSNVRSGDRVLELGDIWQTYM